MKKTLTAAIAIAAIAGLSMAAIETPAAGYVEQDGVTTGKLVCNPFNSFDLTAVSPTLGDIDGSELATGDYIAVISAGGQLAKYYWNNGWYAEADDSAANTVTLARGDAIQFVGTSSAYPLVFSGPVATTQLSAKTANVGYTVVGNAAPVDRELMNFTVGGNYDPAKDYVNLNGTKYIYKASHWYYKDTGADADHVEVKAGQGLFLFCQNRKRGAALNATIVVPSL